MEWVRRTKAEDTRLHRFVALKAGNGFVTDSTISIIQGTPQPSATTNTSVEHRSPDRGCLQNQDKEPEVWAADAERRCCQRQYGDSDPAS